MELLLKIIISLFLIVAFYFLLRLFFFLFYGLFLSIKELFFDPFIKLFYKPLFEKLDTGEFEEDFDNEFEEESENLFSGSKKNLILFIEDDREMRNLIAAHLEYSGFDVQKAADGIKGQALALQYSPDLILLDLMLPSVDGLTLCQRLRRDKRTSNIPILMISALGGLRDKITGFNSGADDYIIKPFDLEELYVRIKALLRRTSRAKLNSINKKEILNYGPLKLDPDEFDVIWFKNRISLTAPEYVLLNFLLQSHDQIVSKESILSEMNYMYSRYNTTNKIKILIMNLRTKLEIDPRKPKYIKTVYRKGYCLLLD